MATSSPPSSSISIKAIAIIGPAGNVGTALIDELLKRKEFDITGVLRKGSTRFTPEYVKASLDQGVRIRAAHFSKQQELVDVLNDQDAVVCCVPGGQTGFDSQKLLIDACIDAGVKLFFASEYSANVMSPQYQVMPPQFVGDKPKIRKYLEEKAAEGKIAWTALNGGPFFEMWLLRGPSGFDITARKATIYGAGTNLACWTPLSVCARAAATMLQNPGPILNRPIFICGITPGVTQNALLEALEAELDAKFEVTHVDVKKIKKDALEALERGDCRAATRGLTINSQFNEEDGYADFWELVENGVVGVEPVSVREAVRKTLMEE